MLPAATTSAISFMGDVPWGTQFCCFFESTQDLIDTSIPFFQAGLKNHDFCLWIVYAPLTEAEAMRAMRDAVPDFDRHLLEGDIEILLHPAPLDDGAVCTPSERLRWLHEKVDAALERGYSGLRVAGSPACFQKSNTAYSHQFKQELGGSLLNRPMIALWHFSLAISSAAEILDAARSNQFVVARRRGIWEIVETSEIKLNRAEVAKLNEQLERRVEERTRALEAANEELRRQKEILQTIFDHIPVMINFGNKDYQIELANREWVQTLGWTVEEIRNQNVDLLAENYPDPEYRKQVRDFVLNSRGEWADFKTKVRDGRVIDTSWAMLYLSDGTSIGIG